MSTVPNEGAPPKEDAPDAAAPEDAGGDKGPSKSALKRAEKLRELEAKKAAKAAAAAAAPPPKAEDGPKKVRPGRVDERGMVVVREVLFSHPPPSPPSRRRRKRKRRLSG